MKIKGAVYIPSRAYNAYQLYENFSPAEFDRDMSYAEDIGLNAIRIFASYEQYLKGAESFFEKVEELLTIAQRHGIGVLHVLFENCGVPFDKKTVNSSDPAEAYCLQSPGRDITNNPAKWGEPFSFAMEYMRRYSDDSRLIGIEVMNEPNQQDGDAPFARELIRHCHEIKKSVPLTIGCICPSDMFLFYDYCDVLQFHDNFPVNIEVFKEVLKRAEYIQKMTGKPVWLGEWQRLRSVAGWGVMEIPEEETYPQLSTLSKSIYSVDIGSFFWSLMVKTAYLPAQRPNGTFNGLFHEDGAVSSIEDYLAISGRKSSKGLVERRACPEWCKL